MPKMQGSFNMTGSIIRGLTEKNGTVLTPNFKYNFEN